MVLEFIEAVATLMNEPLHTDKGIRRFGKHSFRATGAVYLALMGISVEKIQLMGRWSCGVVVHYTRSAPLEINRRGLQAERGGAQSREER